MQSLRKHPHAVYLQGSSTLDVICQSTIRPYIKSRILHFVSPHVPPWCSGFWFLQNNSPFGFYIHLCLPTISSSAIRWRKSNRVVRIGAFIDTMHCYITIILKMENIVDINFFGRLCRKVLKLSLVNSLLNYGTVQSLI